MSCGKTSRNKDLPLSVPEMRNRIFKEWEKFSGQFGKTEIRKMNREQLCAFFKPGHPEGGYLRGAVKKQDVPVHKKRSASPTTSTPSKRRKTSTGRAESPRRKAASPKQVTAAPKIGKKTTRQKSPRASTKNLSSPNKAAKKTQKPTSPTKKRSRKPKATTETPQPIVNTVQTLAAVAPKKASTKKPRAPKVKKVKATNSDNFDIVDYTPENLQELRDAWTVEEGSPGFKWYKQENGSYWIASREVRYATFEPNPWFEGVVTSPDGSVYLLNPVDHGILLYLATCMPSGKFSPECSDIFANNYLKVNL